MLFIELKNRKQRVLPRPRPSLSGLGMSLLGLVLFSGCSQRDNVAQTVKTAETVPVTAAKVAQQTVSVEVNVIGNVEAYSTVTVKSQVEGILERVNFREGQDVRKGELLFAIDPRPFQVALQQAEANLARDAAQAQNAKAQEGRYSQLYDQGIVSKDQFDQFHTNADALDAAVRGDRAAVDNAKINLGYCTIFSPIDGRTGSLMVHEGNLVKANDSNLVVINQLTPIYVNFSVPEQYLAEIKRYMATASLRVTVHIPSQEQNPLVGVLTFIDNAVDTSTGTIHLKGSFENRDRRLWPGQFVNVSLRLTDQPNAIVVPSQAVQTGQQGQYVYVVKPDLTAEFRPVQVIRVTQGDAVIGRGVQPGETIVTDGQLRLYPGAHVEIKKQ